SKHVLAVKAQNHGGAAGMLLRLTFLGPRGPVQAVETDATWKAAENAPKDWAEPNFDDKKWASAVVVAPLGGAPSASVKEDTLVAAARQKPPSATPAEKIRVAKDFKVELLYSVPKNQQGSWVSMCADPRGRLIVSDQYGGLFRVTVPLVGGKQEPIR